jgi:midasin
MQSEDDVTKHESGTEDEEDNMQTPHDSVTDVVEEGLPTPGDQDNDANNSDKDNDEDANSNEKRHTRSEYKSRQIDRKVLSTRTSTGVKDGANKNDIDQKNQAMSAWMENAKSILEELAQRHNQSEITNSTSLQNENTKGQPTANDQIGEDEEYALEAQHDLADRGRQQLEALRQELNRFANTNTDSKAEKPSSVIEDYEKRERELKQRGVELWRCYEMLTADASQQLCEQLRLVLEPLLATKLKGDYRTGKRINMRKVIPFIASRFQKDKIWLRRTAPNKRNYQVVVAIDDSLSMQKNTASQGKDDRRIAGVKDKAAFVTPGAMACEAMTTICTAMTKLEVGELAVVSFGDTVKLLHPFEKPFTSEAAGAVMSQFTFKQESTDFCRTLESLVSVLHSAAQDSAAAHSSTGVTKQLVFMISDGHIDHGYRHRVGKWLRRARELGQLLVLIIVDPVLEEQRLIKFEGGGIRNIPYMDNYPFPFYLVLKNLRDMPTTLGDALRQWFELMHHEN